MLRKKFQYRQWILFVILLIIGVWSIVSSFTYDEGFLLTTFFIGIVQVLASLLFLKWNIFEGY